MFVWLCHVTLKECYTDTFLISWNSLCMYASTIKSPGLKGLESGQSEYIAQRGKEVSHQCLSSKSDSSKQHVHIHSRTPFNREVQQVIRKRVVFRSYSRKNRESPQSGRRRPNLTVNLFRPTPNSCNPALIAAALTETSPRRTQQKKYTRYVHVHYTVWVCVCVCARERQKKNRTRGPQP